MNELVTIRLVGYSDRWETISAIKLIRERACIGLRESKLLVEELIQGRVGSIQVRGHAFAEQFVYDAARCGLIAELG